VAGTDFIFEHEIGQSRHGPYDACARSELDYFSIDIHGWSPPPGTIVIDVPHPFGQGQPIGQDPFHGNFAQVLALAEAHGAATLSATVTNALTIEKPLLVRECGGNCGALAARPPVEDRFLAHMEIGDGRKHQYVPR
jgi:hypothetical protein